MNHSHTSRLRSVALFLLVILTLNIGGEIFTSVASAEEEIIQSSIELLPEEKTSGEDLFSGAILSGSLDQISLSGEDIPSNTGSLDKSGSQIELISSGSDTISTGSIIIDEPIKTETDRVKDHIDAIDATISNTGAPLQIDASLTPELKENLLDDYMDSTEKTRLSEDQVNPNTGISENQITTILKDAIENQGNNEIHLFIKTHLTTSQLQELFGFFDSESPFVFNEQYTDPNDSGTVYEMIFSRDSNLGKRITDYLDLGVVPENFFNLVQIIRPGFVYSLVGSGYLSGESSTANWGITETHADLYQHLFPSRPRIKIGVIDTGVSITHPDLVDNIYTNAGEIPDNSIDDDNNGYIDDVHGYNFVSNTGNVNDVHSHGTHVAGIIGAAVNGQGIYGVYSKAWIVPLKALSDAGYGSSYGISNAIRYAADNGIPVINMSLGSAGTPSQSNILCAAITYARSKGTVSIVSAGNSSINITGFSPAGCQDAIAIGAVDSSLSRASFSNYGTGVGISAPGVSIYSTLPGNRYGGKSGTSMAAPFVAGAVGAIFSMVGTMDTNQVRDILYQNGDVINTTVPMGVALNLQKIFTSLGISINPNNPVITLSGGVTMNIALGGIFVDPGASCVDDIDPICTVTVSGSVDTTLSGTYLITYSAMDNSGNLAIPLIRSIRVSDLTPPVISLSGASVINIVVGNPFIDPGASCVDNYDNDCTITVNGSVNTTTFGTYILTYQTTDISGNKAIDVIRTIHVIATLGSPVITLSGGVTMNIALGGIFVDPGASCVDDIDPICTVTVSGSVDTTLSGTYLITYSAMDNSGNLAIPLIRSIRVSDLTPPVISLSGASVINIVVGNPFIDPGASCVDNYDTGSIAGDGQRNGCTVIKKGEVNVNLMGAYILTYSATDTSGNKAIDVIRTINVVVSLSTPPIITLSGSSIMNIALGGIFVDPGASCVDDIDPICTVTVSGSVDTTLSGTYLITYSAMDSGSNIAISIIRVVYVFDFTPPIITLSGSSIMNIALGGIFVDPGASCVDDIALSCIIYSTGTVNMSLSGVYFISYTAVDPSGNISIPVIRTISVSDMTPPIITLSGASVINIALGSPFVDPGASCVDNYESSCTIIVSGSVDINQTGSYQLLYQASDTSRNNAIAVGRLVIVYQIIVPPVIPPPVPTPPVIPTPAPILNGPGGGGGGSGSPSVGSRLIPISPISDSNSNPPRITHPPVVNTGTIIIPRKIKEGMVQKVIKKVDTFATIQHARYLNVRSHTIISPKTIVRVLSGNDTFYVEYIRNDGWAFIKTLEGYWGFVKSSYIQLLK